MKRDLMIQKRKKARELRKKGWGINRIAKYLIAGKESVRRWLELEEDDIENDNRGWKKGQLRKHKIDMKEKICSIRKEMENTPGSRIGADAIRAIVLERYGVEVSRWFVNRTLRDAELLRTQQTAEPENRLFKRPFSLNAVKPYGDVVLIINFLRFSTVANQDSAAHFLLCHYLWPHKTGVVKMIDHQNSSSVIEALKLLWRAHLIPDILIMNGADWSLGGKLPHKQRLGKMAFFLLNLGIKPLYMGGELIQRQHALKGFPDVFSGHFIQLLTGGEGDSNQLFVDDFVLHYRQGAGFSSKRIQMKNRVFKTALKYLDLENRKIGLFLAFEILFMQVARPEAGITVLGIDIPVAQDYAGQILLARLDLRFQRLYVYAERGRDESWQQVFSKEFSVENVLYE